ncbi:MULTISPECIES: PIG-L deacetylase family protein [Streptomyces]|uniref:PIG-L family deacetylase n=1 Tax=Streptomyces kasugaensis TaxID=1946 RepID=A0A4Q9I0T9_STRKA|nr:PIG-L family deacetylase [Streptomyces kasugaensis]TBO61288.1 PIG-L family deacetylase [Streptomyces kasugaensis]
MTTVLIVVAHPDDAEIAMGMRMLAYAQSGARVRVHCLTTGSPGPNGEDVRRQECLAAGERLGVVDYSFSTIPDSRFTDHRGDINGELFSVFRRDRPDIVYTHFPNDQHLDHIATAQEVTAVALREAADLSYFRSPYSVGLEPNEIFMGTRELLKAKEAALGCFASQQQLDVASFAQLAEVAHRQHVHHRVVEHFPSHAAAAELFTIARRIKITAATGR